VDPAKATDTRARELPEALDGWRRCMPIQLHPTSRTKSGSWTGVLAAARGADAPGGNRKNDRKSYRLPRP
jgi:hypothetical protein